MAKRYVKKNIQPKPESVERNIRRKEVSFSRIQGNRNPDYLDSYLHEHGVKEEAEQRQREIYNRIRLS